MFFGGFVFERKGESLKGFVFVIFALVMSTSVQARADDCTGMAGYYLNDAGKCVVCGITAPFYCPGDNIRYACPDRPPITSIDGVYLPDNISDVTSIKFDNTHTNVTGGLQDSIQQCRTAYDMESPRGYISYRLLYNTTTDKYDKYHGYWWSYPYAGYYLTNIKACWVGAAYNEAARCPAGAYCPGETDDWRCANGPAPENYGMYTCPDNTYSDDGAAACTPCPFGTENSGDTIDDHAGIDSCQPIECAAGQYLADDGRTCTTCDIGYFCPGDNERHSCCDKYPSYSSTLPSRCPYYTDEPGATDCTLCPPIPDGYTDWSATLNYSIESDSFVHPNRQSCRVIWFGIKTEHGKFYSFSCAYGSDGYVGKGSKKCLVTPETCDAGYFIDPSNPGMSSAFNATTNRFNVNSYDEFMGTQWCQPVGNGYYSVDGSLLREQCPAGTSTHTNTAGDASECERLCTAGATEFHVGDYVFNIWPNSECESPAIRLGLSGGTCCVRLERNDGPGLNVDIDGTVYHTVN